MAKSNNPYRRQTIPVDDLRDREVFEWEGVLYRVALRNRDYDSVEIRDAEAIQHGFPEYEITPCITRLDTGQLVSAPFTMKPPVRNAEGDLEDDGPFVDVWRLGGMDDVSDSDRQDLAGRTPRASWIISALAIVASLLMPAIYAGLIPPLGYINGRQAPLRDLPPYWDQGVAWSNEAMLALTGLVAAVVIVLVLTRRLRAASTGILVQLVMVLASMVTLMGIVNGLTL